MRFRELLRRKFVRQISILGFGALASHALALLASPLLSRLFTPDAFGVLGLFLAVASVFGANANLRYELPIVLARSASSAAALVSLCAVVAAAVATFLVAAAFLWGKSLASLLGAPALEPLLYLVPLHVLGMGIFLALSHWASRRGKFTLLAQNPVVNTATAVLIQLTAGASALGASGLVFGAVAGQLTATIALATRLLPKDWHFLGPRNRSWRRISAVLFQYLRYPKYSAPQNIINAASQQLPQFLLAYFFSPTVVGLYWLTVRVLNVPGTLVGNAVRQVFYPRACHMFNRGEDLLQPMARLTSALFGLGCLSFLPVIIFGPWIFTLVFGEPWREAGEYARWVSLWSLAGLANIPAVCGLQALGMQRQLLTWELLLFLSRGTTLLLLSLLAKPLVAVAGYACIGTAFNAWLIAYSFSKASQRNIDSPEIQHYSLRQLRP